MAKKKTVIMEAIIGTGVGIGGAYTGVKITDAIQIGLEKSKTKDASKKAPAITGILGIVGQIFAPPMLKPAFQGMAIAGGTEVLLGMETAKPAPAPAPTLDANGNPIVQQGQGKVSAYDSMQGAQTRVSAFNSMNGYRKY